MRYLIILLAVGILGGCTYSTTYLKHPETGETVKCGPYKTGGMGASANALREIACIDNSKARGYQRMSD